VCVCSCLSCPARQSNIFCNLHYTVASVACPVLLYFFTLFHKRCYFWETKFIQQKLRILNFSTIFSETFVIPRRMQRDIIINVKRSARLTPVILVTVTTITILIKIEHHRQIFEESTYIHIS
jgi:hypothetical protein